MIPIWKAIQAFKLLRQTNGITAAYIPMMHKDAFNELIDTAIPAMQEKVEREKGCPYCMNGIDLETENACEPSLFIEGDKLVALRYDEHDSEAEISFCPKCGRDLRKQAKK